VVIVSGAGDMKVVGSSSAVRIEARGVACAASEEALQATQINVRREGSTVYVEAAVREGRMWSFGLRDYAYINLGVALPPGIPVEATDSSGDAQFEDLAALKLQDSSGGLRIRRITGLADVNDSSGDLWIESAGSVRVRDSSGEMEIEDVEGDVEVELDSSGNMRITEVGGSVRVRQDSSGNIRIDEVTGNVDVDVESDSSGDIHVARVGGNFTVGDDSSGGIGHDLVQGRVSLPSDRRNMDVE
jgi:hypothetical protein